MDLPYSSDGKESACNARDPGLIHGSGRSSGEGNGNPLQYSCLENLMNRAACPWGHKELDTTERLTHFVTVLKSLIILSMNFGSIVKSDSENEACAQFTLSPPLHVFPGGVSWPLPLAPPGHPFPAQARSAMALLMGSFS